MIIRTVNFRVLIPGISNPGIPGLDKSSGIDTHNSNIKIGIQKVILDPVFLYTCIGTSACQLMYKWGFEYLVASVDE